MVFALEYEFTLQVALVATRADGRSVPLDGNVLRETERYLSSADVEVQRKNRQEALRHAANLLAGRMVDALQESLAP